jgi:general secretion pathway protein D
MRGMSFAVVPVKTSQPEKMVDELKAVFASEKEGPLKGRVRFIANTRLGAILVVTSQPGYLPRAQSWIRRLDAKANGSERQLHVYQVQNRPVAELAMVLQSMFSNEMKVVRPTSVSPRSTQVSERALPRKRQGGRDDAVPGSGLANGFARGSNAGSDLQGLAP